MRRAFSSIVLALALAAPVAVAAQTAPAELPDSLASLTNGYFNAIQRADVTTFANTISNTFHQISPDGKSYSFEAFMREVSSIYFTAQSPMGTTVKIRATTITPTGATESVDSLRWYYGGSPEDLMSGPVEERALSTHQLTWIKSSTGKWLLDEDHVTSNRNF